MQSTRQHAKANGDKFYFTGKPCKHGHTARRHTVDGACYECHLAKTSKRYADKRDELLAYAAERYAADPSRFRAASAARYAADPERAKAARKDYFARNKAKIIAAHGVYVRERKKRDHIFAVEMRVRGLISGCLRAGGFKKGSPTEIILGCTWAEFASHIERQFTQGMSWQNRDTWHIDHIVALSTAKTEDELLALNHFTNLRPYPAKANMSKGSRQHFLI